MGRSRLNDLKRAKEIAEQLEYILSARQIQHMEETVRNREKINWVMLQKFLDEFEIDTEKKGEISKRTFLIMQGILLKAMDDSGGRSQAKLKELALTSSPIDRYVEILEGNLRIIHDEIHKTKKKDILILLIMFGQIIRWQILEDFAKSWVYHYGKDLSDEGSKKEAIEVLLGISFFSSNQITIMADTRLYRNAIAHGGFKFINSDEIDFWTRDEKGIKHDLQSLNSGDLVGLYQFSEIRLRTMEIFARVLRAWGRH